MKQIFLILTLVFSLFARDDVDYFKEKDIIFEKLDKSVELYKQNKASEARQLASEAYFQHFENMEGPIGRNIGRKGYLMERKFTILRSYYGKGEKLSKIEALIDGLKFDLDEVTPIIQNGFKIVAVAADPNYDKVKAEENARKNLLNSCIEAQMMFGASKEEASIQCKEQNEQELVQLKKEENNEVVKPKMQEVVYDSLDALQQASAIDDKLQYMYDLIDEKFSEAIALYKQNEYAKAADEIAYARTTLYVNSKLEIAVNAYKNINMRVKLRQFGSSIREAKYSEKELREESDRLLDELFDALTHIQSDYIASIDAPNYVAQSDTKDYNKVADEIKIALNNLLNTYEDSATKTSINTLQDIYLDIFEASGMENKIGAINSGVKLSIEEKFSKGVALIKANASVDELRQNFDELNDLIDSILPNLQDASFLFLFISALTIILREGLEALIIVVAIISYIIQSGNKDRLNIAYSALLTGIVLSFVTAFVVSYFISNSGQSRELIEGVTMLVAVVLLFYVGFWLLSNARNKQYADNLKSQAKQAITNGSAKTLWWSVFLAVFREGAETILFYQALLIDSKGASGLSAVLGGLALGIVILIILYFLLKAGAIRIPIKQFFFITSFIIFYMCFVFTGKGIMELMEGKVITLHLIPFKFDAITWLGLYPYYETLILQAIILLLVLIGVFYMQTKSNSKKGVRQ
ncbi:FTR1 family iron permease [Campylobacter canadensis]|uniref:FTR1 family iron permease n=1 Tax=Campylobacter canadensis TaxID=449520 RepID=UPI001554ECCD|nr:FTR1 family protein [Campylobacter canadensis]MBZ7994991.1 FTR1 family iron permease [Campylobacter canadensis]MBZ7996933.1 FTR1 family iron permease [Campylobacter canadensis]MBZ8000412.1 FTR1 family iron permease [Campylobacter canadensis]MBZ8002211.1 FTR1 family iron permease [Campylobacter canadensis]MBZ8003062.1 FTR1 family iron permease [Campylobacter canadensis]